MRLLHACPPSCKRPPVDDTECEQALARRRGDALKAVGLARSTYYDWHRRQRRPLPPRHGRRHAVPSRIHLGRRRLRVHGRLRARQPLRPHRVLEPVRRPTRRHRRRAEARRARMLPQLPAAALGAGLPNAQRVSCPPRKHFRNDGQKFRNVLSRYRELIFSLPAVTIVIKDWGFPVDNWPRWNTGAFCYLGKRFRPRPSI